MIPHIFELENGKVVLNPEVLLIPELKAVTEFYKDPIPALTFLYFKYKPDGTYCNVPEDDKESILLKDFPGEYTTEDEVMINADKKLDFLYTTATVRYYLDQKYLLEKLGNFARTTAITAGKDGNINALSAQIRSTSKTINEFKNLEKMVQQELDTTRRAKGGKKLAYDG
jgi:hypothetical protein